MLNLIKNMLSKQLVKQVVKVISKNNPYALAAVEIYGLYELVTDKEKEGKIKVSRNNTGKSARSKRKD